MMKRLLRWLMPAEHAMVEHWWCYNYRCEAQGGRTSSSDLDGKNHTRTGHMTGYARARIR